MLKPLGNRVIIEKKEQEIKNLKNNIIYIMSIQRPLGCSRTCIYIHRACSFRIQIQTSTTATGGTGQAAAHVASHDKIDFSGVTGGQTDTITLTTALVDVAADNSATAGNSGFVLCIIYIVFNNFSRSIRRVIINYYCFGSNILRYVLAN